MSQVKDEEEISFNGDQMHPMNRVKIEVLDESSFNVYKETTDSVMAKREDLTSWGYCSFMQSVKTEVGDEPSSTDSANLLHHLKDEAVEEPCTVSHCNSMSQVTPRREEASGVNALGSMDWVKTEVAEDPFAKDSQDLLCNLKDDEVQRLCAVHRCNSVSQEKIKEEDNAETAHCSATLSRSEDEKPVARDPAEPAEGAEPEGPAAENEAVIKTEDIEISTTGWANESKKLGTAEDEQDTAAEQINESRHSKEIDAMYVCTDCGTSYTDPSTRQHPDSFPVITPKDTNWEANVIKHTQHTMTPMTISLKNRPLFCGVCNKRFTDVPDTVTRKRSPREETDFNCDINITEHTALYRHQMYHSGEKSYQCMECGKQISKDHIVSRDPLMSQDPLVHQSQRLHTGEKTHYCAECKNGFRPLHAPYMHHAIDTGDPYECRECKETFSSSFALMAHQSIHIQEAPCKERNINDTPALTQHRRIHTGKKLYKCTECKKPFSNSTALTRHQRIHTGERPYQCTECKKCFCQSINLMRHQKIHTGEKPYQCTECKKCFRLSTSLNEHQKTHSDEKPYECPVCKKCFKRSSYLMVHQRIHTGEKPCVCTECNKLFKRSSELGRHQKTHTGEKLFMCVECKKCFSEFSGLRKHRRVHAEEKFYECTECKKTFRRSTALTRHQRIHTGEKQYQCTECKKCFRQFTDLIRHQNIHTGEKPYQCPTCNKFFRLSTSLHVHQRTHSDQKPYECPVCKKVFKRPSDLISHQRSHTGEKPYDCTECSKLFKFSSDLRRHQKTHTGEKPFLCVKCKKSFCQVSALRNHQKVHEEEQL